MSLLREKTITNSSYLMRLLETSSNCIRSEIVRLAQDFRSQLIPHVITLLNQFKHLNYH